MNNIGDLRSRPRHKSVSVPTRRSSLHGGASYLEVLINNFSCIPQVLVLKTTTAVLLSSWIEYSTFLVIRVGKIKNPSSSVKERAGLIFSYIRVERCRYCTPVYCCIDKPQAVNSKYIDGTWYTAEETYVRTYLQQ